MGDGTGYGTGSESPAEVANYMRRGRTLAEVIFAVACVGFLTGFVAFLCIGNVYRARRAAERQRQRRLANKLLMTAPGVGAVTVLRHGDGSTNGRDGGARGFQYAGGPAERGSSAPLDGGDMSPQSSTSSSGAGGGGGATTNGLLGGGRRFFDAAEERTRLISHDVVSRRRPVMAAAQADTPQDQDESYEEFNFPSHTANLMSV